MTKKELFEELYARYQSLPRYKRKAAILKRMRPYFKTEEEAKTYVEANMQRKTAQSDIPPRADDAESQFAGFQFFRHSDLQQ